MTNAPCVQIIALYQMTLMFASGKIGVKIMAERRMFSSKIVESDDFLEMPFSAQCLYIHLNMNADDDGFLNNAQKIRRSIEASQGDLDLLIEKRFVLSFGSVIVIKHWRMNNQIRKDRYKPTQYMDLLQKLKVKKDGSYTENLDEDLGNQMATIRQPNGNHLATQYSIGKYSIVQDSIGKDSVFPTEAETEGEKLTFGSLQNVFLTLEEHTLLKEQFPSNYNDLIEKLSKGLEQYGYKYKSHYQAILQWVENDKKKAKKTVQTKAATSGNPFLDILNEGDT